MQCDICFRTGGHKLPFFGPTDARNKLYDPRIQHAQVLLENESLDQQIKGLLLEDDKSVLQNGTTQGGSRSRHGLAVMEAEKLSAMDRTQDIILQADKLKAKLETARADLAKRKAMLERRKSGLISATAGTEPRQVRQIEDVEKSIRMTRFKWNQVHGTTASSRTFLCGEAAKLYGLKKSRKSSGSEDYRIGGVGIVGLMSMNSKFTSKVS
jgi:hypothetical protein